MIKFLDGKACTAELKLQIVRSKIIRIAVAFWGEGAADELGLLTKGRVAEVTCNLRSGGTNPGEIRRLIDAQLRVSQCDKLHGKVYLFDDSVVLGSSNASANGLSLQGAEMSGWYEANVITDDPTIYAQTEKWMSGLPHDAINENDLAAADEAWLRRRRSGLPDLPDGSKLTLIEALRRSPRDFANRRIYLCVYRCTMSKDGHKALEKALKSAPEADRGRIDGFENFSGLPDDADLVSFYVGPREGIKFDGFWEMPKERMVVKHNGSTVVLCRKKRKIIGISKCGDLDEWEDALVSYARDDCVNDGNYIDLGDFAEKYIGS